MEHLFAVIMAGGVGTRFWPLSRRARPKQFLPLGRDESRPLIAATVHRIARLVPPTRTVVVTGASLAAPTYEALPSLPRDHVLLEPVGRNTAPCVAWAASWVARRDPSAIVCVLASDAYIADDDAFRTALTTAAEAAALGGIVTVGITPTRAETGYGYLHVGEPTTGVPGVHRVRAFVEKPDAAHAAAYVGGGEHLWNAGIFVFRADVMLRAIADHLPELGAAFAALDAEAARGPEFEREALARIYPTLPNVSIDVGVMEKVADVSVVPVDCGWSDVGGWQAAWELGDRDAASNVVRPDPTQAVLIDARGNMVVAPAGKTVTLIGVDDLVVVDTPDALLVVPRARAQEVKQAVDALAKRGGNVPL